MQLPKSWRPYIAGALVGLLATLSVLVSTQMLGKAKYLGASTTFVRAVGLVEKPIAKEHVENNDYFTKTKLKVDWQFMLVVGVFLGALGASLVDKSFKCESSPPIWRDNFGPGIASRAVGAFIGGAILLFGARMAGGCPSGHGLSGLMQLSISGFLAMIGFFAAGVIVAHLIYKNRGGAQ